MMLTVVSSIRIGGSDATSESRNVHNVTHLCGSHHVFSTVLCEWHRCQWRGYAGSKCIRVMIKSADEKHVTGHMRFACGITRLLCFH